MEIYAVQYYDYWNDHPTEQIDTDHFFATREKAEELAAKLNESEVEEQNKKAQKAYEGQLQRWREATALLDAGLRTHVPPLPKEPIPKTVSDLTPWYLSTVVALEVIE